MVTLNGQVKPSEDTPAEMATKTTIFDRPNLANAAGWLEGQTRRSNNILAPAETHDYDSGRISVFPKAFHHKKEQSDDLMNEQRDISPHSRHSRSIQAQPTDGGWREQ